MEQKLTPEEMEKHKDGDVVNRMCPDTGRLVDMIVAGRMWLCLHNDDEANCRDK